MLQGFLRRGDVSARNIDWLPVARKLSRSIHDSRFSLDLNCTLSALDIWTLALVVIDTFFSGNLSRRIIMLRASNKST